MTRIVVSALLEENGLALLARRSDGLWELPTDALVEGETTEEAVRRLTRDTIGCTTDDEEFVDTYYERGGDAGEPIVRNVFRVSGWLSPPLLARETCYLEIRWTGSDEIKQLPATETQRAILRDCLEDGGQDALPGAPITVITGPAGAGKSTIAGLLCTRLERAAHIEVDLLRDMVISGYASPVSDHSDPALVDEQLQLASENATTIARNFSLAGYESVIDDVIVNPDALDRMLTSLRGVAPVFLITLLPDEDTLSVRDAEREPELRMGQRCLDLLATYHRNGETRGLRVDTSRMSKSETVSWILANRDRARVA
jgi:ADP-ribose pyrophosphatase YjhB (NUDIX family)